MPYLGGRTWRRPQPAPGSAAAGKWDEQQEMWGEAVESYVAAWGEAHNGAFGGK